MGINQKLDELFDEWIKDYPEYERQKFCRDGLVYKRLEENCNYDIEKEWNNAPRKILFLLKDQNDQGQTDKKNQVGSDLRHWLDGDSENCKNNCKIKGTFIKRIAQLLYLLSYWTPDNDINFGEHIGKNEMMVRDCFNSVPFALVESKKLIGTSSISGKELKEVIEKDGVKALDSAEELYKTCQVVSLHIPATAETKNSINYALLKEMPKGAMLVNTARKEVINEAELIKLMEDRADFKYMTDIMPAANVEFAEKFAGRYFSTPKKMGAQTAEANINAGIAAAQQIVGFLKDGCEKFRVNK